MSAAELIIHAEHASLGNCVVKRVRTDQDGRVCFRLDETAEQTLGASGWSLVLESPFIPTHLHQLRALRVAPGENDLGDLNMEKLPTVAAGRVVDQNGTPAAGLRLAYSQPGDDDGSDWPGLVENPLTTTGADGHFEFCDRIQLREVRVTGWNKGFSETEWRLPVGSTGEVLQIVAESSLKLCCRSDDGGGLQSLDIRLEPRGSTPRSAFIGFSVPDTGILERRVKPGLFDIRLLRGGSQGLLVHEWKNVEIKAGQAMDLGEVLVADSGTDVEIEVVVPDGPFSPWIHYEIFEPQGRKATATGFLRATDERVIRLKALSMPFDIEVSAEDFCKLRKTIDSKKARIELHLGTELKLRIKLTPGLQRNRILTLTAVSSTRGLVTAALHLGDDRPLLITVPGPGEYRFHLADRGRQLAASTVEQALITPPTIHVQDAAAEQSFELVIDGAALEKALEGH